MTSYAFESAHALAPARSVKLLTAGMRLMLYVASGLVFTIGITLNFLTENTAEYFAWPINPPLTAAFLGAGYWASCAIELLAARERVWANARIAGPAVFVFTALTFILTVIHRDRFNFDAPMAITVIGTWTWLAVYALVPLILGTLMVRQWLAQGAEPPRLHPLPLWIKVVLLVHAAVMLALGAALFIAPTAVATLWPWALTALTGRAVGAWLIGFGIVAAQTLYEGDWDRLRPMTVSYALLGLLQVIALLRYAGSVEWTRPGGWIYLLFVLSCLGVGVYGIAPSYRAARHAHG